LSLCGATSKVYQLSPKRQHGGQSQANIITQKTQR
jgi:hypothetical protein